MIVIESEKCKRDGICAQECPLSLISWSKGEMPEMVQDADNRCVACGHCLAVCPQQALSLEGMPVIDCQHVNKKELPTADQVEHFMKTRRSIRIYQKKNVSREMVERLLGIAGYAPSVHNSQPVSWLVVDDREKIQRLNHYVVEWMSMVMAQNSEMAKALHFDQIIEAAERGEDRVSREAPCMVMAYAPADSPVGPAACLIAATYLELAAYGLGLGACWAGYFNVAAGGYPPMEAELGLPEGQKVFASMMIGYPKLQYYVVPKRIEPRVSWL
ncbi:MAG: nitroreductase family protein [Solirubrobacterales bacterium]